MELIYQNLNHLFCILLLIGRLGDVVSTYFATPNLKLEANPLIRKFRFPFAVATIFICLVPYWNLGFGLALMIGSYMISFMNISKLWFLKTLGEDRAFKLQMYVAQNSNLRLPVVLSLIACSFLAAIGVICLLFYPRAHDWGFYFGIGFIGFAVAIHIHAVIYFRRIFKASKTKRYQLTIEEV